jgi:hypothetical protein
VSKLFLEAQEWVVVTARGLFGPDRIRDTVVKSYCSVAGTVAAARYFPVSPIPETEREIDQLKNMSLGS